MRKNIPHYKKIAYALILLLVLIVLVCLMWILSHNSLFSASENNTGKQITADIYQDGVLLQSIDLNSVTEPYTFTVTGANDCHNEIEVRPGSIGIISADCPDKLCVHQGFVSSSLLPITCLPNRLVIQIRSNEITPDIVTY